MLRRKFAHKQCLRFVLDCCCCARSDALSLSFSHYTKQEDNSRFKESLQKQWADKELASLKFRTRQLRGCGRPSWFCLVCACEHCYWSR